MPASARLDPTEREGFRLISQAVFSNPFSDEFAGLICQIAGCDPDTPALERLQLMIRQVNVAMDKLDATGRGDLRKVVEADCDILRNAFLFDIYHRHIGDFDRLIADQIAAGDRPLPVPFAPDALRRLARRGFGAADARRCFAMFYQVRRAYFFIDRGLVGRSPCMKQLRRHLWNNVFTHDIGAYFRQLWNRMEDFSTLLLGETGTGKGTAAAAIGRSGFIPFDERRGCFAASFTAGFVALNLSEHPETLIESELFGHRKGAFTGAVESHEGIFARCSPHGAIFLDEIGEIPEPVQLKLLRVLQERTFSPVGSHEKLRFHGRVIAATNKPPDQLRGSGGFRDDFFYRLCSDIVTVPPLRQRIAEQPAELDDLLQHIMVRLLGAAAAAESVAQLRRRILDGVGADYPWPGNVRELEQAARRILLTGQYDGDHRAVGADLRSRLLAGIDEGALDADAVLSGYCRLLYERFGTYEQVARRTHLDRRTVKAYIERAAAR
jgi:DNA-binding NtrC family response regulator